jgi:hypothetical protein
MTFFDKKEEVIDIQLTQHGKHLLSIGKFKPAYYEFFDDDIIYDSKYSSVEESQRDIQTRIKEAVRPHVQYNFVGSEEEIKKLKNHNRSNQGSFSDVYVPYNLKHRIMSYPLAHSEVGSNRKPSWNIKLLKGEFSSAINYITGTYCNSKYPRITMKDVEFKHLPSRKMPVESQLKTSNFDGFEERPPQPALDFNDLSTRFRDETFILVKEDYILLDIQELNVPFQKENFELELYEVGQDADGQEELKQLYFLKEERQVVNNLLTDENTTLLLPKDQSSLVNNFFNFSVDREIRADIMCSLLSKEEIQRLRITNQIDLRCSDSYADLGNSRIITDVSPNDAKEEC